MTLMVADEPEVAAACTTALLSGNDPAVRAVRDRIGAEIHRRIRSAMGPDADPRTRVGAGDDVLRRAGPRGQRRLHLSPDRRPTHLRGRPHPRRGPMTLSDRSSQRRDPRPVRLRLPRGSVPVLQAAARRGPALPQRGARLLGAVAPPATCWRASATARRCPTATASRSTRSPAGRTPARRCRSWRWTTPPTCACAPWCPRASRRAGSASSSHGSPNSPSSTSTMLEKADAGDRRLRRGVRRQAADGRHLRADGRARRGPRPHPGHGRRRHAPRGRRQRRAASRRSRRRST